MASEVARQRERLHNNKSRNLKVQVEEGVGLHAMIGRHPCLSCAFAFLIDLLSFLILVRLRLDWIALGVGWGLVLGSRKALALPAERASGRAGGRGRWLESVKGGRNDSLPFSSFGRLLFWRSGSKGPATDTRCHVGRQGWMESVDKSLSFSSPFGLSLG